MDCHFKLLLYIKCVPVLVCMTVYMWFFGCNDLNFEGHLQMGCNSKTIKNYGPIDKQLNPPESTIQQ